MSAQRRVLGEWGIIVTLLLGGIALVVTKVRVAEIVGWLAILIAIVLVVLWWSDLWRWREALADYLEITLIKREEDHIGFMPGFKDTPTYLFSNVTALLGSLSGIRVINHHETVPTEVLSMRLSVFDLETGKEIQLSGPPEIELAPVVRDARRIPAGESRWFGLRYKADYSGYIGRENPSGHVFLMVKVIGSKDELKITIPEEFFPKVAGEPEGGGP